MCTRGLLFFLYNVKQIMFTISIVQSATNIVENYNKTHILWPNPTLKLRKHQGVDLISENANVFLVPFFNLDVAATA